MTRQIDPIHGSWWLPGKGRKSRDGVLQQLANGHFELTLRTAWHRDVMTTVDRAEGFTLWGKDEDGRLISLMDGFLKQYNLLAPESSSAIFHFDRVFLGTHSHQKDEMALTELSARLPAIGHWLEVSGLTIDVQSNRELAIHFSQPQNLEFELEPGLKLVFGFDWRGPTLQHPQLEASIRHEAWLMVRAVPARSFGELETVFNRMLNLISLLVGEALGYESLLAEALDARKRRQKGTSPVRVDVLFSPIAPEQVNKVVEGDPMLITFREIQAKYPTLFQCWFDKYKVYRSAFAIYFSVQLKDPAYQEQRFLSMVQAVESFHRLGDKAAISEKHHERLERIKEHLAPKDWKWLEGRLRHSHEPNLLERLERLLKPFGDLFGNQEERRRFAERTADTRNYLTHYDPEMEGKAVKPARLTPYIYRLKILFILRCLLEVGLTPNEARQAIEGNHKLRQMVRFGKI